MSVQQNHSSGNAMLLFGQLALRFRMINEEQLKHALSIYQTKKQNGENILLGQVLVSEKLITPEQLDYLVSAQKMKDVRVLDRRFGDIAVRNEFVTEEQVQLALLEQKERFMKGEKGILIGDILVERELLSADQKESILHAQKRMDRMSDVGQEESIESNNEIESESPLEIAVTFDRLQANLNVFGRMDTDAMLKQLHALIGELNINYGLRKEEEIVEYLRDEEKTKEPLAIAIGKAPLPARDETIKYHFDTDPLNVGKLHEGGVIDFKDRGEIPQVSEGDLLAEILPGEKGIEGVDVYGQDIDAPEPREALINCGDGVTLSADGSKATASLSGTPCITKSGSLFVFPVYRVDGDIGYDTGHVEFDGDIQVKEGVESEFKVQGGRLSAREIRAAHIDVKGDVVVIGGIIGAKIKAGGSLKAWYIHKADIDVAGDVIVQQEVVESDVKAGGEFIAEKCTVLASRVSAGMGMSVGNVGSDAATPATLVVGTDEHIDSELQQRADKVASIKTRKNELVEKIKINQERNEEINTRVGELAQIQDSAQVKVRELKKKLDTLTNEGDRSGAESLGREIQELEKRGVRAEATLASLFDEQDNLEAENRGAEEQIEAKSAELEFIQQGIKELKKQKEEGEKKAIVKVYGSIHPLNRISGKHTSVKIKDGMKKVVFTEMHTTRGQGSPRWVISAKSLE